MVVSSLNQKKTIKFISFSTSGFTSRKQKFHISGKISWRATFSLPWKWFFAIMYLEQLHGMVASDIYVKTIGLNDKLWYHPQPS